jgi:hypothetical protein
MSLKEMMDKVPNYCEPAEKFTVAWGVKNLGWGEFIFYIDSDHKVHCHNELMSKRFIKEQLCKMVDDCILDEPPELAYREEL